MRKGKVLSISDESYDQVPKRVTLHLDTDPPCPYQDWDQLFEIWSNIPREMGSSKDAINPVVEIEDEDGCGTGKYKYRDGLIVFPVTALIHSGIYLRMGSTSFAEDPGGWDTSRGAIMMYTDRERVEKMGCGWMRIYDEEIKQCRDAKDFKEFEEYLYEVAKGELHAINLALQGSCYGYVVEKRRGWRKQYEDGEQVEGADYEDDDSVWGYLTDKVDEIDFPKDLPVFADRDCSCFVGDEFEIPECVIVDPERKGCTDSFDRPARYLKDYRCDKDGKVVEQFWTNNPDEAYVMASWWTAQAVGQRVIPKDRYDAYKNIQELDKAKEEYAKTLKYADTPGHALCQAEGVNSIASGGCSVGSEGLAKGCDTHGTERSIADTPSWMTSGRHG